MAASSFRVWRASKWWRYVAVGAAYNWVEGAALTATAAGVQLRDTRALTARIVA